MGEMILVTGATGYIGGRLTAALELAGHRVRCLARRPEALRGRAGEGTDVVRGDCLEPTSLGPALSGVHTAYYLVPMKGRGRLLPFELRGGSEGLPCISKIVNMLLGERNRR